MRLRIAGLVAVVFACTFIFLRRQLQGQSGPPTYTTTVQASYQHQNLMNPTGLYMRPTDPNYLFISDTGHHKLRVFTPGSGLTDIAGHGTEGYIDSTTSQSEFDYPTGISGPGYISAWDGILGHTDVWIDLTINDSMNHVVRHICKPIVTDTIGCGSDSVTTRAGNGASGYINANGTTAEFSSLGSRGDPISGDSSVQSSYIPDPSNYVIRALDSANNVATFAGNGFQGLVNGSALSAEFSGPTRIAYDVSNNLYVSDAGNYVIRKIDTAGNVTTFAGTGTEGYIDGPAASAEFALPTSLVFNPQDGYIYVADHDNNCIRRIDSSGNVTTYAGTNTAGDVDGSLTQARFSGPTDLVINGSTLYVSDTHNNAIRQINMSSGSVSTLIQ